MWQNPTLAAKNHAFADMYVVSQPDLSSHDHVIFDDAAARNAGLGGDYNIFANAPRSTVLLAPISTLLPTSSRPICGNFS
jgi:hypothetical protein